MLSSKNYGNRNLILETLSIYKEKVLNQLFKDIPQSHSEQIKSFDQICGFIQDNSNCFMRENLFGHVTSSAFVVNSNFTQILFTYHAKLKKWLQLGGHCDGEHLIHNSAMREAMEESGLKNLNFINILEFPNIYNYNDINKNIPIPFDLDIHLIPERNHEPAHFHFDIRYLLIADEKENIVISEESLDLKWISMQEAHLYTNESSTLRQVEKFKSLLKSLN
ncbi:NUDIX hydrolase [Silvanigrella sp.]|jgi:8-oxo-dGTP pyrophosphatase MutT (NUDIX family)|uniref:NUDIX hydrolase n=1 Tax=Silvanigrella sp. TaxID=2024976 RepID=UPI0037C6BD24